MKRSLSGAAVLCCFFAMALTTAQASSLIGSTVTGTLYNPDLNTILGGPTTAVVGASTPTFPNGSILGNTAFEINITGNQIFYYPLANVTYGNGIFNGFVFVFSGAPTILGVTLDPASSFTPYAIGSTANSVFLNLSANSVTTGSLAVLDLQLQPTSIPEPATWTMLLTSVGWLKVVRSRRRA